MGEAIRSTLPAFFFRTVLLVATLTSCNFNPGNVTIKLEWSGTPPQITTPLYAYARVEQRPADPSKPGTLLQVAGPAAWSGTGGHLDFTQFPNGNNLVVVAELHQTANVLSPVVYDGASSAFTLNAGETRTITVVLAPPAAAPATTTAGAITYVRTPWGSAATGGSPAFAVTGAAAAVAPNTTVVVLDGSDPSSSTQLGSAVSDSTGAFTVTLPPVDHSIVYVATVDPAGNDSVTAAVHDVTWTATFGGKTPGNTLTNPHVLQVAADFQVTAATGATSILLGPLVQDPELTREAASYSGLALPDGKVLSATTATAWHQRLLTGANPFARTFSSMAYDSARGVSVVFGGQGTQTYLNDTWEWDGETWSDVTPIGPSPAPRSQHGMVYDAARGVMVMFGGDTASMVGDGASFTAQNDTWTWDGQTWTNVTPASGGPSPRVFPNMAYDSHRGVVVLYGGCPLNASFICQGSLSDTWEWNGVTWKDVTPANHSVPPPLIATAIAFDSVRNVTLMYGGINSVGTRYPNLYSWDGQTWKELAGAGEAPPTLVQSQMVFDSVRGVAVIVGGDVSYGPTADTYTNGVWEWNGSSWASVTPVTATAPQSLVAHSIAYDAQRQTVVLFSGFQNDASGYPAIDTWEWQNATWTDVTPNGALPGARTAASVFDPARNVTVLADGCGVFNSTTCTSPYADTWEWNGHVWNNVTPATGPSPRGLQQIVYDSLRGVSVLYGGCCDASGNAYADTWEWDGTAWTDVTPASGPNPSGRMWHGMSYDSGRGVTVLYGGCDSMDDCNGVCSMPGICSPPILAADVWEWDGSQWNDVTPPAGSSAPSGRGAPAMGFDARDNVTVLFGGNDMTRAALHDTWTWSGLGWSKMNPAASPAGRSGGSLAWDVSRSVLLLFGGFGSSIQYTADEWEWDGANWTDVTPTTTTNPPASTYQSLAYDSSRGDMVLFGGHASGENFNDLWEVSGDSKRRVAEVAQFSFAATGAKAPVLQQVAVSAVAGASGDAPVANGATLAVWDAWSGAWKLLATNGAKPVGPATLQYGSTSSAEAARYLAVGDQSINVALVSPPGIGNGSAPASIAVDSLELTVSYTQP